MKVTETSKKRTGNPADHIVVYDTMKHVIGEAWIPYVGLQYVAECAHGFAKSLPWYQRTHEVYVEIWRRGKLVDDFKVCGNPEGELIH